MGCCNKKEIIALQIVRKATQPVANRPVIHYLNRPRQPLRPIQRPADNDMDRHRSGGTY